jgi:uncharacterized protein (DUF983 family)
VNGSLPPTAAEAHATDTLRWPGPRGVLRLLWRTLRLACPRCGRGPVLHHWLKMRSACGHCGGALQRGEPDHFVGAMMFNLVVAELLFAGALAWVLISSWPTPPWAALERYAPWAAVAAPILLFPFTKLLWLGADLLFRPDTPSRVP